MTDLGNIQYLELAKLSDQLVMGSEKKNKWKPINDDFRDGKLSFQSMRNV